MGHPSDFLRPLLRHRLLGTEFGDEFVTDSLTPLLRKLRFKERRMKFANATNLNRKSGGAKPRDLRFRGPLLETRNDKGEVGVSMRIQ
jgi:hypothetical protein